MRTCSPMTTVGVDWLLSVGVSSRATATPESILRSSNSTPRWRRKRFTQLHGGQSCCVKTMTLDRGILICKCRFTGRSTQDAIHDVRSAFLRLVEVSNLELT